MILCILYIFIFIIPKNCYNIYIYIFLFNFKTKITIIDIEILNYYYIIFLSKIKWDLTRTNGPLLDTAIMLGLGVRLVGPNGNFLDYIDKTIN